MRHARAMVSPPPLRVSRPGQRPPVGRQRRQIVIWDPTTGTEYSFWQFARLADGTYTATNGYRYHTTAGYNGRFADGLAGRGAGTPYFAGLVRKWEIDQGRIDHALAFAYDSPSASSATRPRSPTAATSAG